MKRETYPKDDIDIIVREIDKPHPDVAFKAFVVYKNDVLEFIRSNQGKSRSNPPDTAILDRIENLIADPATMGQAKPLLESFGKEYQTFAHGIPQHLQRSSHRT